MNLNDWQGLVREMLERIWQEEAELRRTHSRARRRRKLMRLRMKCLGIIHLHQQMAGWEKA